MGNYEDANRLAVLNGAEHLNWQQQTSYTGPPTSTSAGISVLGSQVAKVAISVRKYDVSKRYADVTLTYDVLTTYTVDAGGVPKTSLAAGSVLLALTALRNAINADPASVVIASLIDADGDGTNDTLRLIGEDETNWTLVISVAAGAGTIAAEADPADLSALVFERPSGITSTLIPPSWRMIEGYALVEFQGLVENFNVGGAERLYVWLSDLAGPGGAEVGTFITYTSRVDIGPAIIP